jgi:hypothetical protein
MSENPDDPLHEAPLLRCGLLVDRMETTIEAHAPKA